MGAPYLLKHHTYEKSAYRGHSTNARLPAEPLWYVPVEFRSANGSCCNSPLISPPVEYHEQNAADKYLPIVSLDRKLMNKGHD